MMVIFGGRKFPQASRDHFLVTILIATAKLAKIHNRNISFLYKRQFFFPNSTKKKVALYFLDMDGGDYSTVNGCSNDRRKPDKAIVMGHVGKLRWYGPRNRKKRISKYQKLLNTGDYF